MSKTKIIDHPFIGAVLYSDDKLLGTIENVWRYPPSVVVSLCHGVTEITSTYERILVEYSSFGNSSQIVINDHQRGEDGNYLRMGADK